MAVCAMSAMLKSICELLVVKVANCKRIVAAVSLKGHWS